MGDIEQDMVQEDAMDGYRAEFRAGRETIPSSFVMPNRRSRYDTYCTRASCLISANT
jgi:hypothetical protein